MIYDETSFLRAQCDGVRAIAARADAQAWLIWVTTPEAVARDRLSVAIPSWADWQAITASE